LDQSPATLFFRVGVSVLNGSAVKFFLFFPLQMILLSSHLNVFLWGGKNMSILDRFPSPKIV